MNWTSDRLEEWAAPKDDKQVAWTLGIGWACCGGGLAGGCLVFAKATVKLLSGSLSHENPGNQFGHAAPIFTIILLSVTAVLQIICLNRGLKVYDSTLVVPVFYGVYTATGWLDSLIFNDEVGAYKSWTLFLIFVSILVLISGVVLLTHKKPEPVTGKIKSNALPRRRRKARKGKMMGQNGVNGHVGDEEDEEENGHPDAENEVLWGVGDASDEGDDEDDEGEDEDVDHHQHPLHKALPTGRIAGTGSTTKGPQGGSRTAVNEQTVLVGSEENDEILGNRLGGLGLRAVDDRRSRRSMDPFRDEEQELDDFSSVGLQSSRTQR
ncbi:hypothetical protein CPB84DRAFT_1781404 [Gymnopilus junonius]|uniref:Uncharacterized protein n=1 Tax=Gymnopilus junonius TaxID=109634 RepID=A0A9P5NMV0_GYMJU|nr:hypothetical protein CPB84DRAFT_1781404 [Gymnopilus junonius]